MIEKWKGKIAVVTGSLSGIGFAVFQELIKHGIIAIGLDIYPEKTEKLIGDQNLNGFVYKCDVGDYDEVTEVFEKIESKFGVVNILINNAGIGRKAEILDDDEKSLHNMNKVIDTNFRGVLHCTRKAFKLMNKSNDFGLIINLNSVAGHIVPFVSFSMNTYSPSKFAVTSLTETIRQELFRANNRKVRVTSISPGLVDSEFSAASGYFDDSNPHTFSDAPSLQPIEIAKCIMFILSTPYEVNITELTVRSTGEQF